MVRTRADGIKAVGAKAPRKVAVSSPRSGLAAKGKDRGGGGGNAYNPQPTPAWQRPVASFFAAAPSPRAGGGSSDGGRSSEGEPSSSAVDEAADRPALPAQESEPAAGGSRETFSSNGLISDEDD